MFRTTYLKKFLLSGSVFAATIVTASEIKGDATSVGDQTERKSDKDGSDNPDPGTGKLLRRTDLPLYDDIQPPDTKVCEDKPSSLEKNISAIRKELWVWLDKYSGYRERVVEIVETGKAHTSVLVEQLRKDELPIPKPGAIAIGGLAGVVLGLRGGWFKRIIYGSTAAGLMSAVCYPQEAQEALSSTKKYVQITYNFIYGVKPENFKLPSPSQLLGGIIDKGKGDSKSSTSAVSEDKAETAPVDTPVTKKPRQNDQSNPADKDLYTNRG